MDKALRLNLGAYDGQAEVAEGRSNDHLQNAPGAYHGWSRGSGGEEQRLTVNTWLRPYKRRDPTLPFNIRLNWTSIGRANLASQRMVELDKHWADQPAIHH